MGIEHRTKDYVPDWKDPNTSDMRAAIHGIMSTPPPLSRVKRWIKDTSVQPLGPELSEKILRVEAVLTNLAGEFGRSIIVMSPVSPKGLVSSLTKTDPKKISHGTGRPVDIVSDPTIDLVTEAYRWRARGEKQPISLGTNQRCFRLQRYANEHYKPHFSMFATLDSTSGYKRGRNFSVDAITSLAVFYSRVLRELGIEETLEFSIGHIGVTSKCQELAKRLDVTTLELSERKLLDQVNFDKLKKNLSPLGIVRELRQMEKLATSLSEACLAGDVNVSLQLSRPSGVGHYNSLAFYIIMPDGKDVVDGGTVDWLSQLTSNRKEYTVVSGMGTQLLAEYL